MSVFIDITETAVYVVEVSPAPTANIAFNFLPDTKKTIQVSVVSIKNQIEDFIHSSLNSWHIKLLGNGNYSVLIDAAFVIRNPCLGSAG